MYARSDRAKKGKQITGSRYIDIALIVEQEDMKTISVRLNIPNDTGKATLWINKKPVWTED
ncbi:hypothetical protein DMB44_04160 [Thermoplasma sp. Kam2015]|nr:hypothetical protein DMB44_04160 [Thermoplasma sp. Kam2015]